VFANGYKTPLQYLFYVLSPIPLLTTLCARGVQQFGDGIGLKMCSAMMYIRINISESTWTSTWSLSQSMASSFNERWSM